MEYTINKLAQLAGVSTRTLRYYDECGLLPPKRINSSGYRIYGPCEVDRLQEILFYRELGVALDEIQLILKASGFQRLNVLTGHLFQLQSKRSQIDTLITNVEKSILAMKGEITMSDQEKFEGFKEKMIQENEEKYGAEIRKKYGDAVIDASNAKLRGLSNEEFDQQFRPALDEVLREAFTQGDPASELAQEACAMHKDWLCFYWPEGMYSREAHLNMGKMYVEDERFKAYYDKIAPGLAEFLLEALKIYTK